VNRRLLAVLAGLAAVTLSSCATFNRNDVAAQVGDTTLSATSVKDLVDPASPAISGDATRTLLTKWITLTALEKSLQPDTSPSSLSAADLDTRLQRISATIGGEKIKTEYDSGAASSPAVCLAAIPVTTIDDATPVLAELSSGASFADAARKFSIDEGLAQSGGVLTRQDGGECFPRSEVPAEFLTPITDVPAGTPVAAQIGNIAAVLMLRPFDELLPESQSLLAGSSQVAPDTLQTIVGDIKIYVDPRYGRWDPATASVVPLSS
jgi:hypothetical protein